MAESDEIGDLRAFLHRTAEIQSRLQTPSDPYGAGLHHGTYLAFQLIAALANPNAREAEKIVDGIGDGATHALKRFVHRELELQREKEAQAIRVEVLKDVLAMVEPLVRKKDIPRLRKIITEEK